MDTFGIMLRARPGQDRPIWEPDEWEAQDLQDVMEIFWMYYAQLAFWLNIIMACCAASAFDYGVEHWILVLMVQRLALILLVVAYMLYLPVLVWFLLVVGAVVWLEHRRVNARPSRFRVD